MTEKHQCSERYESGGLGSMRSCQIPAIVKRNGKWYCKIHDPEYIKAKAEKRDAEWDAKRKAQKVYYDF